MEQTVGMMELSSDLKQLLERLGRKCRRKWAGSVKWGSGGDWGVKEGMVPVFGGGFAGSVLAGTIRPGGCGQALLEMTIQFCVPLRPL